MAPNLEAAIEAADPQGEPETLSAALSLLAFVTANLDAERAIRLAERAAEHARGAGAHRLHGLALAWGGVARLVLDELDAALDLGRRALEVDPDRDSIIEWNALHLLAWAHTFSGSLSEAREEFERAAAATRRFPRGPGVHAAGLRMMEAMVYAVAEDEDGVRSFLEQARQYSERIDFPTAHVADVALAVAELLVRTDRRSAATELIGALAHQPFSSPLHYWRYRRLRDDLDVRVGATVMLTPRELYKLARRVLNADPAPTAASPITA
jgi:tetratricopeptide (TPR) repeat protein